MKEIKKDEVKNGRKERRHEIGKERETKWKWEEKRRNKIGKERKKSKGGKK